MNKNEVERINARIEKIKEHYFAPNGKPWTPQDLSKAEKHIDELLGLVQDLSAALTGK